MATEDDKNNAPQLDSGITPELNGARDEEASDRQRALESEEIAVRLRRLPTRLEGIAEESTEETTEDENPKKSIEETLPENEAKDGSVEEIEEPQKSTSVAGSSEQEATDMKSPGDTTATFVSGEDDIEEHVVEAGGRGPQKTDIATGSMETEDDPKQPSEEELTTSRQVDVQENETSVEIVATEQADEQNDEGNSASEDSDEGQSDFSGVDTVVGSEEVETVEEISLDEPEESTVDYRTHPNPRTSISSCTQTTGAD
ncbi:uncharacterized protein [Branchiostoma lanceolatum]|uniref:uncharacterized protein n=1 Tax=Branchiostoma lanceolatum TaxID=7740 RepID=UPI0034517239